MDKTKAACILVVDDHADTVSMIDRLLTARGYKVLTATTAAEAAALLRSIKCDVLVTDIGLPDGSGLGLMQGAAGDPDCPKGIAVSGHATDEHREAAEAAGFVRFHSKPVDFRLLLAQIGELTS